MHFEYLANEIFLNIFEYIDAIHLFRAFHSLNARFDLLLFTTFHGYNLDFRSVCKPDFENICKTYLPCIKNRIKSIHLSDNEETPNLSVLFLSYGFKINQFINLRTFSLYNIQVFDRFNQLISQCHHLPYLTHLNMIRCYFNYRVNEVESLMNNIWSLEKLSHCILDQISLRKLCLTNISIISTSIRYLTFEKITCDLQDLSHLCKYTPCLEKLSINFIYGFPNQQLQFSIVSILSLKMLYHGSITMLKNLIENLPNLIYLTLETVDIYCDGTEWEHILVSYLPKLQDFKLKMNLIFPTYENINQQVNDLLDTFRTRFWLIEHRWFVRCDWDPLNIFNSGMLYTLPYSFDDCFYFDTFLSKSTCTMEHTNDWSYDRVFILSHKNPENDISKDLILFSAHFSNIRHLKISFPFDEKFWSCISSLNRLTSIDIMLLSTDFAYSQLQDLLNRTANLYSLKVSHVENLSMYFFIITSRSIRRLDLMADSKSTIRFFNRNECAVLVHSPLIHQCEVLLIGVNERLDMLELINAIPNLRALVCHCKEDEYNIWTTSFSTKDELIDWLESRLSSKCLISRDETSPYLIRIWIDRR